MTFRPWLKTSMKPVLGGSIWWLSGLGFRSRQNESRDAWFDDFPASDQEIDKTSPRRLDLMTFWPWLQKSRKPVPGGLIEWLSSCGSRSRQNDSLLIWNDPEYRSWETFRIALGSEKYKFCLIKLWFSYIYARSHQEPAWTPREDPGANTLPEHQWAAITGALVLAKWKILENTWFCNFFWQSWNAIWPAREHHLRK